ncbi:dermonecrotic toxin domain-containing protein [Pseudomonas sp. IT-P291]|uniref:dermonecrotic toxin domain-containing protein n=1 Tax=Pseudomonas sp. IT-P291 TaxID=3026448 RepID=UPI0039E0AD93
MQTPEGQRPTVTTSTTHSEHPATHYQYLKSAAPEWLGKASPARRQALKSTQPRLLDRLKAASSGQHAELKALNAAHWTAQNDVDQQLARLQDASRFAEPLLTNALKARFGLELDVRKTFLRLYIPATIPWFPIKSGAARTWTVSLLDAALHNFEDKETEDGAYEPDSTFITEPSPSGQFDTLPSIKRTLTIPAFTKLCRELDIGGQYKTYLEENLGVSNPDVAAALRPKVDESQKAALKAALQFARMNGDIQEDYFRLIQGLLDGLQGMRLGGEALLCHDLTMMSAKLTGVILFAPNLELPRVSVRVVAYIPDDPEHPIKEYRSTGELMQKMTRQLRDAEYQNFFSRFVSHEDRGYFFGNLANRLAKVTWHQHEKGDPLPSWRETPIDRPDLQFAVTPIDRDLWTHLYQEKLNKILNDARGIAVSTAAADQKARWELWDSFVNIASTILQIAAFVALPFVPFLGEMMLAYMAWQLLDETFEGIVDWAQGLTAEAFEHLMGMVESLVQLGAFAVGGTIVAGEFRRVLPSEIVKFIDQFKPVQASNGKTLYWKPDLTAYEQKITLPKGSKPDHLGIHEHQGKSIVPIEGKHYAVQKAPDTDAHYLQHPDRPDAYKSPLNHNGSGAWKTELDRPLHWDKTRLARRLGHRADAFSDLELDQILSVSDVHENVLRKMHVQNESVPPLLTDTLERFRIEKDIQSLIDQLKSDDPEEYRKADPQAQLQLLTSYGLWPKTKALRFLNAEGKTVWVFSEKAHLPVVQMHEAQLNKGDLLKTVLETLDQDEIKTIFGEGFGDPTINIDTRANNLRKKLAQTAEHHRASLFESRYRGVELTQDPHTQKLMAAEKGLPSSVAQQLLSQASGNELREIDNGLVPTRLKELAHQASQEVRVTRAYEGLYLDSSDTMDTDRLALHSLEKLPGWSTDVRMEVHDRAFGGPPLDSIGNPQAPIRRVLTLNTDGQYQPYDDEGLQLYGATDLYTAVLQALPDTQRNMLDIHIGQKGKLRQAIRDKPLERNELRVTLSLQPIREPVVQTLRLLGSDGYPRATGEAPRTLQQRAREVYPGLSPDEIQALIQRLRSHPEGPHAELSRLRNEYFQLVNDLHIWANNPPRIHPETQAILSQQEISTEIRNRRLLQEEILRCWRKETDLSDELQGAEYGYTLKFSKPILGEFPVLSADFSHISVLSLNGSSAARATNPFLEHFPGLRRLEMRNFVLRSVPQAISTMPALDELVLSDCGILLTPDSQATLSSLHRLSILDLYNNPLGLAPSLEAFPELTYIDLSNTGISSVPAGLTNHPRLRTAIFNDNHISELPASVFDLPANIGEGFDFGNNPLSSTTRERIKTYYGQTELDLGVFAEQADIDRTRALYPSLDNEQASDFIYRLPGTLHEGRIELTRKEAELTALISDLTLWATDVPDVHPTTGALLNANEMFAEHAKREEFMQNLERCWRQIPTPSVAVSDYGFASHLAIMGDLPVLTADFSHVPELHLTSAGNIAPRASQFLEYFPNLESLSVRGYQLDNIPEAVFRMGRLTALSLPECRITLTQETLNALAGMERLDYLNLRENPLGLTPDLSNMTEISSLNLSHTGITEIPRGLLTIESWMDVDLSNNAITEMPAEIMEVDPGISDSFNFSGNPFTEESLQRIAAHFRETGSDLGIDEIGDRPAPEIEAPDTDTEE